ncbi:hypothetical protein CGRA01v4_03709 [Colletotrichum graminicola]|nr:hypothetical protein CGRA01v4_03709 [Colletotrichum graminicola]
MGSTVVDDSGIRHWITQHQCDGVNVPELLDSVIETILRATAILVLAAPSGGPRSTVADDVAHRGVSLSNKSKTKNRLLPLGAWSRGMIFASHFRQERDITVKGREFNSHSVHPMLLLKCIRPVFAARRPSPPVTAILAAVR